MMQTTWLFMTLLGASLLETGCGIATTSKQEDLGRGIVQGTLGVHSNRESRPAIPVPLQSLTGQVTAVEGGAYVVQEIGGTEQRVAHDENTRIDRPAHVGDRIEAFVDDKGRAILVRNVDHIE
ncbi:MAG: hypothetical protein OEV08_03170 [Nitrospira sp.]|nr:hypothetical protein [Nitrospira sp.]